MSLSTKPSTSTAVDGKESTKAATRTSQRKRTKAIDTAGRLEPRTKTAIRPGKTGRLSQLMNVPMDILMEIFGHLHPLDLLHVARTTKAFRRVLMHRSSLFVWKAAISSVPGLPDCPPELSEPQWVNLAFDAHCSSCLRPNIRTVDWVLRVRLCTKCIKLHVTNRSHLVWDNGECCVDMTSAVPTRPKKRGRREFLRDEYDWVCTQYLAIENLDARAAFLTERKQLVRRVYEHARLCIAWASSQATVRSDELDRLKSSRYQAIVAKLVALGWGDEIEQISGGANYLKNHKLVKVPQLLTDRIWANISGTLIEYMKSKKADRLARELAQLYTQRKFNAVKLLRTYKTQKAPFINVLPEPLDFYALGPIKEILDQPPDINVDSESFLHLMPELDGLVEEWRHMILAKFIQEMKVGIVNCSVMLDDNPLDLEYVSDESILQRIQLACTVFACTPCNTLRSFDNDWRTPEGFDGMAPPRLQTRALWFPRVLGHRCLTKRPRYLGDVASTDDTTRLYVLSRVRQQWSCQCIQVDEKACAAAVAIVEACKMDLSVATVDDMDQLDARLECLHCYQPELDGSHFVFGWRSAVRHQCESHPSFPGYWRMLTASESNKARAEENRWNASMPNAMIPADQKVWLCLHCLGHPSEESWKTPEDIRSHLKYYHHFEDWQVNHDYVKDFAAPELYPPCTVFQTTKVKFPA